MAGLKRLKEIDEELARLDAEEAKKEAALQKLKEEAARTAEEIAQINRRITGFASAAEWDRAYRAAPWLDSRGFLERVKSVRLEVEPEGSGGE